MKKGLICLVFTVMIISLASASFNIGNKSHEIGISYGPGDYLSGWINISLNKESGNSVFHGSFGNDISLIDLINKTTGFSKTCVPVDCTTEYTPSNGELSKTYTLGAGESKIFGIKFEGQIVDINYINFTVQSNAAASCENQLGIDFGNDNTIDLGNSKSTQTSCSSSRSYGCFDNTKILSSISLDIFPKKYCQRIKLPEAPGFKIGAWVKKESGIKTIRMAVYDISRDSIEGASCKLPDASTSGSEISCNINFSVSNEKDYYVCIYQEAAGTGSYKIKGYSDNTNGCGFYGEQGEIASYQIFAEGLMFDKIGTLEIANNFPEGNTLGNMAKENIWKKYKSYDCSEGCLVPVKLISKTQQTINLQNLKVKYETSFGSGIETNQFYEVAETPASVSADFQKLNLDSVFKLPTNYGNVTFELKLKDSSIFSEKIKIEKVPVIEHLYPTTTVAGMPTEFELIIGGNNTITDYYWEFGDGGTQRTTEALGIHTYNATGNFSIKVTLVDNNKFSSSKSFEIFAGNPKEIANKTLVEMQSNLTKLKSQIAGFDAFYQKGFNEFLNVEGINEAIKNLQVEYKNAKNERDYIEVMEKIIGLEVPESIDDSRTADSISFLTIKDDINLDILKKASGGSYDSDKEEAYKNSILAWEQKNIETKVNFKEFSAEYKNGWRVFVRFFDVSTKEKQDLGYNYYFIVQNLENLTFKQNYLEAEDSGYNYITLKENENTISFYTSENVDFSNLPLFISSEFSKLSIITNIPEPSGKKFNWGEFSLILLLIVFIAFIIYIVLQLWYKNKYEKHLFGSRNELFNVLNYINNAKSKEIGDREIESRLRKSGWNSEQISYAMKKYYGKKTGMFFEIPIDKILGKLKGQQKGPAYPGGSFGDYSVRRY